MTKPARFSVSILCAMAIGCAGAARYSAVAPGEAGTSSPGFRAAAGCEAPIVNPRLAHFVDPQRGSPSGDGSRSHPWQRLSDVLTTKMSRIHPGDVIYLASGNYGAVSATADNVGFVEVTAEPGQHPVLQSLDITGARWVFSGLKIQSLRSQSPGGHLSALVNIHAGANPAGNIVLHGNDISVTDDVSAWTPSDWLANGLTGVKIDGGTDATRCIAITNNSLQATGGAANTGGGSAIQIYADHSLVADNTIDHFADDAIDFGANDLVISGNRITNNIGVEDGNHNDAMQGFVPGGQRYKDIHAYRGITIDSNLIVRQTDPSLRQPAGLQGIDDFGGTPTDWYDVKVINNVVITNAYNGITFGALHHGLIANNTVLADGWPVSQRLILAGGKEGRASVPGDQVWIMVTDQINHLSTPGGVSSDVIVNRNISTILQVVAVGAHVRQNIAIEKIALPSLGKPIFSNRAGEYGDHNVVDPSALSAFTTWRPSAYRFDLSRKAGRLVGQGSSLQVLVNPDR